MSKSTNEETIPSGLLNEDDKKTFFVPVSEEEAKLYPEYDGVNDEVSLEDAE